MVAVENWNTVAIVAADHMQAVVAAASLRRAGIAVETFLQGNPKRQWKKAACYEVVVLLDEGPTVIDRVLGGRLDASGMTLLDAVRIGLEGIEGSPHENF